MKQFLDYEGLQELIAGIKKMVAESKEGYRPTVTLTESEWELLKDNTARYAAFCVQYDGYDLDIVEDGSTPTTSTSYFGSTFGFTFGGGSTQTGFGATFGFNFGQ